MSGPQYTLDTSVCLALLRARALGEYIEATYRLTALPFRPVISIASRGELGVLAAVRNWGRGRQAALRTMLDNLTVIAIDSEAIVDAYVEIDLASRAHKAGAVQMGKNDLWIAATALVTDTTLLTTDRDFQHLAPELVRVAWIAPDSTLGDI